MNAEIMYLGRRKIYSSGNSRHISIPKGILKELEGGEKNVIVEEAELFYNREKGEMLVKFIINK